MTEMKEESPPGQAPLGKLSAAEAAIYAAHRRMQEALARQTPGGGPQQQNEENPPTLPTPPGLTIRTQPVPKADAKVAPVTDSAPRATPPERRVSSPEPNQRFFQQSSASVPIAKTPSRPPPSPPGEQLRGSADKPPLPPGHAKRIAEEIGDRLIKSMTSLPPNALNQVRNSMDFEFAFNNPAFSDRVLVLETSPDVIYSDTDVNPRGSSNLPKRQNRLHINSAILAVKSPFFFKLFTESGNGDAILRVRPEDEGPVIDMLRYNYNRTLFASTSEEISKVLTVADRYNVAGCVKYCYKLLAQTPLNPHSACRLLEAPAVVKDLAGIAVKWLTEHFQDLDRVARTEEFLNLTPKGLETVLSSDSLICKSEATVFNALIGWARHHYPDSETQRARVVGKLAHLIRFPWMTPENLKAALELSEMSSDTAKSLVMEALFFKAEPFFRQQALAESNEGHQRYKQRQYDGRVTLWAYPMDESCRQAVLFMEVPMKHYSSLPNGGRLSSRPFFLGGRFFTIELTRKGPGRGSSGSDAILSFLLHNCAALGSSKVLCEYEFFTRLSSSETFDSMGRGKASFKASRDEQGQTSFRVVDRTAGKLHIRLDVTMKSPSYVPS